MPDACTRIICLTYGHEWCPRWISLEDGGDEALLLPVCGVAVESPVGWVLLETGIGAALRDPAVSEPIYGEHQPLFEGDGEPVVDALAACGLEVSDIVAVGISHLHVDHSGGLPLFVGGPPIYLQKREWSFANGPDAVRQAYVPSDYSDPNLRWHFLEGDAPIVPGIDAVATPGHTPGHQSFRVRMANDEAWLFAIDAIDLDEGIRTNTPIGSSADPADAALRRVSHDRLVQLAKDENATLVAGHCPVTWPDRPGPPSGHAPTR